MASDTRPRSPSPSASEVPQGITVTYSGHASLLEAPPFKQLLGAFATQLPLRNLHWRPSGSTTSAAAATHEAWGTVAGPSSPAPPTGTGAPTLPSQTSAQVPSIRTIQTLDAHLVPFTQAVARAKARNETRDLFQKSLLERPYCHIYFVLGDDSEAYRTHTRNDIRAWINTIQTSPSLSAAQGHTRSATGTYDTIANRLRTETNGSGSSTGRPQTPPSRPDTPKREGSGAEDVFSKERLASQSPEFLIVVITPPDGSVLSSHSTSRASQPATAPLAQAGGSMSIDSASEKTTAITGLGRFYSSSSTTSAPAKGSVIEKVRADFSIPKKERIVHLTRLPTLTASAQHATKHSHVDPTIFADLTTRLKECVTGTFGTVVGGQEDAVRREFSKRDIPGWNFNKWMAGAECLANTFEGVGLFADALSQYDEIETVFRQALEEDKLPFFYRMGGTAQGDDSAPLLDYKKKPYRDLILRNEVTLFDFRCYLFAKRANLLGKTGRISQVMSETPTFTASVASMLRGHSLPPHFVESWVFSSSLDVVEQCQAWLVERGDVRASSADDATISQDVIRQAADRLGDAQLSVTFHAGKAELLDTALRQLDRIGMAVGHLPKAVPFSLSAPDQLLPKKDLPALPDDDDDSDGGIEKAESISRQELLDAIDNRGVFDLRYTTLAERALSSFKSGQRKRNILRIRCALNSLDFFRGKYTQAYSNFATLSEAYSGGDWPHVQAIHLARHLACHDHLKKPLDRAWVSIVLALMKTKVSEMKATHIDESTKWLDEAFLYSTLQNASRALDAGVPVSNFEPLEVKVLSQPTLPAYDEEDGAQLWANVENRTSTAIQVDDVRVCIADGQGRELWFTSGKTELIRGRSTIRVVCPACSDAGMYSVDVTQIRLGKVIFQYNGRNNEKEVAYRKRSALIHVREDGDAFDIRMEWMPHVHLDRSRIAIIRISTGRNKVSRVTLHVTHEGDEQLVSGVPEARLHKSKGVPAATMEYDDENDCLLVSNLSSQTKYAVLVPIHEVQGVSDGLMQINVDAEYWSVPSKPQSRSSSRRIRRDTKLSVGLPLGVNVQDFFRHECLLSKFLISAGNDGPLCLGHVELRCDDDEDRVAESGEDSWHITSSVMREQSAITEDEPASCAFAVRKNAAYSGARGPLRLTLAYRTAYEEAAALLLQALEFAHSGKQSLAPAIERNLKNALVTRVKGLTDVSNYAEERNITFKPFDERTWRQITRRWSGLHSNDDVYVVVDLLRRVFDIVPRLAQKLDSQGASPDAEARDTRTFIEFADKLFWRRLSLPVEVPTMKLVNAVTIKLQDDLVRVGVPVKASVDIKTSVQWDAEDELSQDTGEKVHLSVDVQCDFVHWLLVGSKRAIVSVDLSSKRSGEVAQVLQNRVDLTLVALQSGPVPLPSVSVWPLTEPAKEITPPSNAHRKALESNGALSAAAATDRTLASQITCDSYITNEAERVRILPRHALMPTASGNTNDKDDEDDGMLLASQYNLNPGVHQHARFSHTGAVLSAAATVPRETYWVSL